MKPSGHNGQTAGSEAPAWPAPTSEEQGRQDQLTHRIREEIARAGGAISFARFMQLALYAPGLGYYTGGRHKFGEHGDFITAPELGPLFARCLARPCRSVLQELKGGDILEAGAGSGTLAADLLLELESLGSLPEHYFILELSAELRVRQAETLRRKAQRLEKRVSWLDALPAGFRGIVLANELLDAMPVNRFTIALDGIQELLVAWESGRFVWREQLANATLRARIETLGLPVAYVSETHLQAEAWLRSIADILAHGAVVLIDYGFPRTEFYHPQRTQGTLMCHYRHRAHDDPLRLVGLQDITAHVDFSALAEAAVSAGLALLGYTSQAAFLLDCGLEKMAAESDPENVRAHLALTEQIKKLTMPHEMGELYKVIAFGRNLTGPLPGFGLQDRRGRL